LFAALHEPGENMAREEIIRLLVADGLEDDGSLQDDAGLDKALELQNLHGMSLSDTELVARIKARGLDMRWDARDSDDLHYQIDDIELSVLMHNCTERLGDR
jgi:hypothetical protein